MKRKILYVSGTRADFGLLASTLIRATKHPALEISVCVTGMHLRADFGNTQAEIVASGLRISAQVPAMSDDSGASMVKAIGQMLSGITDVLVAEQPDIVLVLGDRGEMLAAALAAAHLGIPVVHIHGGERSGTIDESVRHAISKIAHYHFVSTEASKVRLIRMGELPGSILVTGAPGLDGLTQLVCATRQALAAETGLDWQQPIGLLVYHPVLQEAGDAGVQAAALVQALRQSHLQVICALPNADAGNAAIRTCFLNAESTSFRTFAHLPRNKFVSWMAAADVMVGNSSSGIIEAASLNLPVVNVGDRQLLRERSNNVLECSNTAADIARSIELAMGMRGRRFQNVYGDGQAGDRIVNHLASIPLNSSVLKKSNAY